MTTRLMFIYQSSPLAQTPIRFVGESKVFQTDGDGRITLPVGPGTYEAEVQLRGQWRTTPVSVYETNSLIVVNVSEALDPTASQPLRNLPDLGERYELLSVLGRGGMGIVYQALDRTLQRQVAIKVLNEQYRDHPEARELFLKEARSLATLSHPNLMAIHDVTIFDEQPLMITEFVRGRSLEEALVSQGAMGALEVLKAGIQLTAAVAYLHERKIIHRDIKPANALIELDGTIKLIDFGLARSLEHLAIRSTRIRGTPAYMAPEQVRGGDLTMATDVYQLGITFYELISNQLPFADGDMSFAHLEREVPPLLEVVPDIPEELAALIHRCVEKDPSKRFASAQAVLDELNALWSRLTHSPLPAARRHTGGGSNATLSDVVPVQQKKKKPIGVAILLFLVVGVSSFVAVSLWSIQDEPVPVPVVEDEGLSEVLPRPEVIEPRDVEKDQLSRAIWTAQTQFGAAWVVASRLASVQEYEPIKRPIPRAPQTRLAPQEPTASPAVEEPVVEEPAAERAVAEKPVLEPEPERAPIPVLSLPTQYRSSGAEVVPQKKKESEEAALPPEQEIQPEEPRAVPRNIPRTF